MKAILLIAASIYAALFLSAVAFAQGEQPKQTGGYRIYKASGETATLDDLIKAFGDAEVVFIGETHDNPLAHRLELQLLDGAYTRYHTNDKTARNVTLSLEMFERDVQTPLDEYLSGLINEQHFLASSRPWNNYQTDYKPLIEFARAHKLSVIAANAPARYVNRAGRMGRDSLAALSTLAKSWLAPLPYFAASPAYAAKFNSFMESAGGMHQSGGAQFLLDAQVLRDATMAYSIAERLKTEKGALVLQVNGDFHSSGHMGVPEQLQSYRRGTRIIVITIIPSKAAPQPDAEHLGKLGDFVVITESSVSGTF